MHLKGIAVLYYILAYTGCFIALIESQMIYVRILAGAYTCLLTFQIYSTHENKRDDYTNNDAI
jgi:hypothetical protein